MGKKRGAPKKEAEHLHDSTTMLYMTRTQKDIIKKNAGHGMSMSAHILSVYFEKMQQ